jgi:FkbM family methyltransferase
MIEHGGFYFPDGEQHFIVHFGDDLGAYQAAEREAAYGYVTDWRTAIDLGANVGLFSRPFSRKFETVWAFEPVPQIRECLELNVGPNVIIQPYGVADKPGSFSMHRVTKGCGGSFIFNHPDIAPFDAETPPAHRLVEVELRALDSFDIQNVGLIKLDIQGAEFLALKGAENTIKRCKPVVLIEEKPRLDDPADVRNVQSASDLLISWGMVRREKVGGDRIYTFADHVPN